MECGVNKGGLSRAVMHYIDFRSLQGRRFFLLDTFRGFPEEYVPFAAQSQLDSYRECYQQVRERFKEFADVRIVRGKVPETLPQVDTDRVCYLSLDMNCAEPEIAAAEYFWPKLVSGAVIVLDDYGYSDEYLRQKRAFDKFAQLKSVQVLLLPTGQGLIFKP